MPGQSPESEKEAMDGLEAKEAEAAEGEETAEAEEKKSAAVSAELWGGEAKAPGADEKAEEEEKSGEATPVKKGEGQQPFPPSLAESCPVWRDRFLLPEYVARAEIADLLDDEELIERQDFSAQFKKKLAEEGALKAEAVAMIRANYSSFLQKREEGRQMKESIQKLKGKVRMNTRKKKKKKKQVQVKKAKKVKRVKKSTVKQSAAQGSKKVKEVKKSTVKQSAAQGSDHLADLTCAQTEGGQAN
jgi:hypothetical protein